MSTPISHAQRIVIKVGSSLLIDENNQLKHDWLSSIADDIVALTKQKKQIIIVTSGAIALGKTRLGMTQKIQRLEEKQAAAACGQIDLFAGWRDALAKYNMQSAQLLLTADDSIARKRYLNARATLEALIEHNAIPIINENDTVATSEIRFGDNDRLSARIAQMAGADMLILLSDIDGLYNKDPSKHADATFIKTIETITPEIEAMAQQSASAVGTGGMVTKLAAAKIALSAGCDMIIARGTILHPIKALQAGGTHSHFIAKDTPLSARKRWLAGSIHASGSITLDAGAQKALQSGKSILPAGVIATKGDFMRGDAVLIKSESGTILAKGIIAYDARDAKAILGKNSRDIEAILGFRHGDVLIHRNDLVME